MDDHYIDYGGFVWNNESKQYEILFKTNIGENISRNRASERAKMKNRTFFRNVYDPENVRVYRRTVFRQYGEWSVI